MLKNYFLWVSLSVLGLAGCSRSERMPATAGAPVAASPRAAAPSAATALALPAATGRASANTLAPAPVPAPGSTEATRLLALLEGPRRRSATTLAAATPEEPAGSGEEPAPDSARTAELRRFLEAGLPAAQVFTVRPGRDTLLMGTQGTQVLVPAHAWDLPDSTTVVQLALREFYSPADIILAGLSTTAGPQLLETGGMVHLNATANGQPVALLPGRPVLLRFPAPQAQPDMQLFEGVVHGRGQAPDWQLPTARAFAATQPGHAAVRRPGRRTVVRPGQRKTKQDLDSLYISRPITKWPTKKNFPLDMVRQMRSQLPNLKRLRRSPHSSQSEKDLLDRLSSDYDQRIVRQVSLRFVVDSAGVVDTIEPVPGSDLAFGPTAVAALRRLARWQPATVPYFGAGQVCTEAVAVQGLIEVLFSKAGEIIITSPTWVLAKGSKPRAQQRQHEVRELLASPALRRRYLHQEDSLLDIHRAEERAQWAKDLIRMQAAAARQRTQFTDTSRAAITQQGVYNEFWAHSLQWLNCDRFKSMQPQLTYQVRIAQHDAVINLIFQDFNSMLCNRVVYSDGSTRFPSLPGGRKATLVALRRENGITYLAKQLVEISETPLTDLRFHPVTMAQLRAELAPAP